MRISQIRLAALALTSGLLLAGCAYDDYGYGYGGYGGYGPYGYGYPQSGVSIGVGYGGGYGGYGYGYPYGGYYGGYGYPYGGYDPFGWYGDYYYPGSGIYVYDSYRNRHVWSGDQQRYWTNRRQQWQSRTGSTSTGENWSGWHHRSGSNSTSTSSTATTSGTTTGWRHHRD